MPESFRGDPGGRRLARKRAALLAEAGQVARALDVLLKRAEFETETCAELVKQLAIEEKVELQKSEGRIEPRTRFKPHVSHPLLEQRPRSMLYIDENGKSKPEPRAKSRPTVFALGAVAMPAEAVDDYCAAADEIKLTFFNRTDITFHEPQMRNREELYYFGDNKREQSDFDEAIDQLVRETDFVALGVGVRKEAFADEFVQSGIDPYLPTDA